MASCFGTSAEKVPLHISSGKQAEQMLRAKSQSTNISAALTPHLTEPSRPGTLFSLRLTSVTDTVACWIRTRLGLHLQ